MKIERKFRRDGETDRKILITPFVGNSNEAG